MKTHDRELGEKNQSEKCLPHKHEDPSSDHQNPHKEIKSQARDVSQWLATQA